MFYNNWIQFFYETYLFLGVCAALNFSYFKFDSDGNSINSLLALFFGLIIVVFPFFVIVHYNLPKNKKKIIKNNAEFFERFGSVLDGLNFLFSNRRMVMINRNICVREQKAGHRAQLQSWMDKIWMQVLSMCTLHKCKWKLDTLIGLHSKHHSSSSVAYRLRLTSNWSDLFCYRTSAL